MNVERRTSFPGAFLLLVGLWVAMGTGCGLINGLVGRGGDGGLLCDDNGENCRCPDDDEDVTCNGVGCVCLDNEVFCESLDDACEVVDSESCENGSCSCFSITETSAEGCDCGETPGSCQSEEATNYIFTQDPNVGCLGTCECTPQASTGNSARCQCGDEGGYRPCVQEVVGETCNENIDCVILASAVNSDRCAIDDDCVFDERGGPVVNLVCDQRCVMTPPCPPGTSLLPDLNICGVDIRPNVECRNNVCQGLLEAAP